MNLDGIKAHYRRLIEKRGETVTLRRYVGTHPDRVPFDITVSAVVTKGEPKLLAGNTVQGKSEVIILAEDVDAQDFIEPIRKDDKVVIGNKEINVDGVDMYTRRFAGTLVAYGLEILG
jgi:hypothetical protein